MTSEELLIEAKRRYPKGTVYIPAHISESGEKCTVSNLDDFHINKGNIFESSGNIKKNGHGYIECVYACGKWAEIISKPDEKLEIESEFLTELGNEWYSLVGYKLLTHNGTVSTIVEHNKSGSCLTSAGKMYDIHNIDSPYNMKYKGHRVYSKKPDFELMPEGFVPEADKPIVVNELKVGQWVKIIDEPKEGRPNYWNAEGEMDKYFGQWVQVAEVNLEDSTYDFFIKDEGGKWYFKISDYTEVRDDIINLDSVIKSDKPMPLYSMADFKVTVEKNKYPMLKRKRKQKLVKTIVNIPTIVEKIKRNK
jgi:hypothetical protein